MHFIVGYSSEDKFLIQEVEYCEVKPDGGPREDVYIITEKQN